MTMPHSAGWYDDPDGSGALRYFDGHEWTPQRKRKSPRLSRPPGTDPYAPAPSAGPPDPHASAYPYPAGASDPHGALPAYGTAPPVVPADPYRGHSDPYGPGGGPYGAANSYGPGPATGPVPYGYFPPVGPSQRAPLSRLKGGMAPGPDRIIGIVTAVAGAGLAISAFATWGRVGVAGRIDEGVFGSASLSFPGIGDPDLTVNVSGDGTSVSGRVDTPLLRTLHDPNPGWIALVLGIVAIIAGIAYLWLRQRMILAVAVAVLSGIAGVVCISHIFDIAGTFGNPPGMAKTKFSPGGGLIAACVLSFALAGLGITGAVLQWSRQYRNSSY
jgi:hypothetical protein